MAISQPHDPAAEVVVVVVEAVALVEAPDLEEGGASDDGAAQGEPRDPLQRRVLVSGHAAPQEREERAAERHRRQHLGQEGSVDPHRPLIRSVLPAQAGAHHGHSGPLLQHRAPQPGSLGVDERVVVEQQDRLVAGFGDAEVDARLHARARQLEDANPPPRARSLRAAVVGSAV
jgi:hypothetical protein